MSNSFDRLVLHCNLQCHQEFEEMDAKRWMVIMKWAYIDLNYIYISHEGDEIKLTIIMELTWYEVKPLAQQDYEFHL